MCIRDRFRLELGLYIFSLICWACWCVAGRESCPPPATFGEENASGQGQAANRSWCLANNEETPVHTLMDMRTDLTAVPHAGLGFHFLRVEVRKPEKEVEVQQVQQGHRV